MEQIPEKENVLRLELAAPDVYIKLAKLSRTGWVKRGVENPESVKEHTVGLLELALEMWDELSKQERDGLLEMLEVHDWPEAIHGDEVILELNEDKRKELKAVKFENEKQAMRSICGSLENGDYLFQLWVRFETSDDVAAVFGRQLDKYQAVQKALEYEEDQGLELFKVFHEYSLNFINHPILLDRMEKLKIKWGL